MLSLVIGLYPLAASQANADRKRPVAPRSAGGPSAQWRVAILSGNRAFEQGDLSTAREHYQIALEAARSLPADDLRTVAALRNLGQVYGGQGYFDAADSLYRSAIGQATRTRRLSDPYVKVLLEEWRQLRLAASREPPPEQSNKTPTRTLLARIGGSFKLLTSEVGTTVLVATDPPADYGPALGFGLGLRLPAGFLPFNTRLGLEAFKTTLASPQAGEAPFRVFGLAATLSAHLGRLSITAGAGQYTLEGKVDTRGPFARPVLGSQQAGALLGGISWRLGKAETGLQVSLGAQAAYILGTPAGQGNTILITAGLKAGWAW